MSIKSFSIFLFLAVILLFPFVSAVDTPITVKTVANHVFSITLNVLDSDSLDALQTYINDTDSNGQMEVVFSSTVSKVTFSAIIRDRGSIVLTKRFGNYTLGSPIILDTMAVESTTPLVASSEVLSTVNQTIIANSSQNLTNTTINSSNSLISGKPILNTSNSSISLFFTKTGNFIKDQIIYILGTIILVILIFFIVRFFILKKDSFMRIPKSDLRPIKGFKATPQIKDRDLANAERKIREAQEEIDRIRNKKQRMADAEKRYEESKRELDRLRRGY
jgi:hypothetical protein